jgi:hypothetical protein
MPRDGVPEQIKNIVRQRQKGICVTCQRLVSKDEEVFHFLGEPSNPGNVQLIHRECPSVKEMFIASRILKKSGQFPFS